MVGKGTPDEIVVEARIWEKLKGLDFNKMNKNEIREFLIQKGIGIDCSGFVTQVLDRLHREEMGRHIWSKLKIYQKGFFAWLRYFLRPVENLGANTITGDLNAYPIEINDVKPGDVIRSKWKKANSHHIQLITKVERDDNNNVTLIEYTHSTPYYKEHNGVKVGQIKITDSKKPLQDQEWLEKDENGVNFSYEGFLVQVEDNGLRRLKCLENLI